MCFMFILFFVVSCCCFGEKVDSPLGDSEIIIHLVDWEDAFYYDEIYDDSRCDDDIIFIDIADQDCVGIAIDKSKRSPGQIVDVEPAGDDSGEEAN